MLNRLRITPPLPFSLAALFVLAFSGISCSKGNFTSPIAFSHLAVAASTNANFVCVAITNQSDSVVFCLACPLQGRSNGIWSGPPMPPHQKMTKLTARQTGVVVVDAGSTNENTRVPILWGYDYPLHASRLRWCMENMMGRLTGRNPRGLGALYTNYLTDIKL